MKRTITICRIPEWSEAVLKTVALNGVGGSVPLYGVQVHNGALTTFAYFPVPSRQKYEILPWCKEHSAKVWGGMPTGGYLVHCHNGSGADC